MSGLEPALPSFDLYRELEVDPNASAETIDAAWRSLAKRHHPDANPSIGTDRIRRLNIAHDWLADSTLRARYDSTPRGHRAKPPAAAPPPDAARSPTASQSMPAGTTTARPTIGTIAAYGVWCLGSVVVANVIAIVAGIFLSAANVTAVASALVGEDIALTLVALVGNLLFAAVLGYLVAASFISKFGGRDDDVTLPIVGAVAALGMTFGFPAFALSYFGGLAQWMVADGGGLPSIAVLGTIEAAFVGSVVAGTAWLGRAASGGPARGAGQGPPKAGTANP